jgi:hypothetical protein
MRPNDLRGVPWTMLQPDLPGEAIILTRNLPFEETDPAPASKGVKLQKIMPPKVRDPEFGREECSCLTFFARVLIWGTRNSRAE